MKNIIRFLIGFTIGAFLVVSCDLIYGADRPLTQIYHPYHWSTPNSWLYALLDRRSFQTNDAPSPYGVEIGSFVLGCGHKAQVFSLSGGKYYLLIYEHGTGWNVEAGVDKDKITIKIDNDTFVSFPPYDNWTWIKTNGEIETLPKGCIGDLMCVIIAKHLMRGGGKGVKW